MATIPARVRERLVSGIKRFQPVLQAAKSRDVNESDTVTIVKDMLAEVFGFDKYTEITSEYSIKSTYVDLATRVEGQLINMVEVKAIGLELKDSFVKQAVDYGSNEGVDWVILTNGVIWQVYKIIFAKPIEQELVLTIDFMSLNAKRDDDLEALFMLSREGYSKSVLGTYHTQRQALNRYFVAAILLTEPVMDIVRRQLKKISPDVKIDSEQVEVVLVNEVMKREVLEGEKAAEAKKKVGKLTGKVVRRVRKVKVAGKDGAPDQEVEEEVIEAVDADGSTDELAEG